MLTKIFFICSLLLLHLFAAAQNQQIVKDSSTIIFPPDFPTHKPSKQAGQNNIIKIAPLGFLSGTFPLLYERKINDFFSVVVGGGLTGKDYSRSIVVQNENNVKLQYPGADTGYNDISEALYSFNIRTPTTGYMFSVQPRVYFKSEALKGSFMGISYDHYTYNFNIPAVIATTISPAEGPSYSQTGPIQQEHENITDYMVHFGYQNIYDRLTYENSFDIGMRNVSGIKYVASSNNGIIKGGFASYKEAIININFGIKVGFHF